MKTTIGWTASFLLLVACGRTPTEEDSATGTGTASATDTEATGTQPSTGNSGVSDSETNTPTDTGGSVSNSQTDTGETTATATTSPVTVTDTEPDPTVTVSTTESTGPGDTSVGDTSSSSESMSVGESSGSSSGSSVGETTSTTSGETTSTTSDDTTSTTSDDTTSGTTGMDVQCGLQLNVTIRDFLFSHPDMEDYCCGQVNGLVQPDLGPNGKPVFAMVGNPKMLTDAPTFDQWYTDVNGVNQKTMIVIDLMEIMPGVYSYQNNSFFPVDNILWGNEGQPHNFHFTTVHDTS